MAFTLQVDADMNSTKITISATHEPEKANSNARGREAPSTVDHTASTLPCPGQSSDSHQRCGSPEKQSTSFLLPDLNMMPSEEDPFPEALNGASSGETLQASVN